MRMKISAMIVALLAIFSFGSSAHAQLPPPGYILDVGSLNSYGPTSSVYQYYSTSFTATLSETTVAFAFREVPAYFSFDDASVSLTSGGPNLLADPGFESATVGSYFPTGWTRFIQSVDVTAIGIVSSGTPTGSDFDPYSGSNYWVDGSVQGYDGLAQTLATTIGSNYTIGFYMADSSGSDYNNPDIEMFVYAGNGLPVSTVQTGVPEPSTWAMMLLGFAGIGLIGYRASRRERPLAT